MLAWKPTREMTSSEFKSGVLTVAIGLGASFFVAGLTQVPGLVACLIYLAGVLGLAAIRTPDWLSQVMRRAPTRGGPPQRDGIARAFLVTGALAALTFAAWAIVRQALRGGA